MSDKASAERRSAASELDRLDAELGHFTGMTSLRPGPDGEPELTNPYTGQVTRVAASDLREWFRDREPGFQPESPRSAVDATDVTKLRHWWQRSWVPSLDAFLLARRAAPTPPRAAPPPELPFDPATLIRLPAPSPRPLKPTLGEAMMRRKTLRRHRSEPLPLELLGDLAYHGLAGLRVARALPTGPLESYWLSLSAWFAVLSVGDLAPGIYRYHPLEHALVPMPARFTRDQLYRLLYGNRGLDSAAFTLFLGADFADCQRRHPGERALLELFLATGVLSQDFVLAATASGVSGLTTPAMRDSEVADALGITAPDAGPVYSMTMGLDPRSFDGDEHAD